MKRALLALALAGLAACSVGPDFQRPQPALPAQWQNSDGTRADAAVDTAWWQQLGDEQLTALVTRAAKANLDIRSASNRVGQSQALRQVSGSQELPGISARGGYQRERNSAEGLNDPSGMSGRAPFELWTGALDASWELDLWGHVRRSVEMADADV